MVWSSSNNSLENPPADIDPTELLARSVHSTRHFKRGIPGGEPDEVRVRAFEPETDKENPGQRRREVSMDRCNYLTEGRAVELGCQRAKRRGVNFYGWAIILEEDVRKSGAEAVSSPSEQEGNPAHADILLPANTVGSDEDRNAYLLELAKKSYWLEPLSP